jgi:hypothetical protein
MGWCSQGRLSFGSSPVRKTLRPPHLVLKLHSQITAGEQIDLAFGAKLGLSSMAAAGLGNTVADVVGINISHSIEVRGAADWRACVWVACSG